MRELIIYGEKFTQIFILTLGCSLLSMEDSASSRLFDLLGRVYDAISNRNPNQNVFVKFKTRGREIIRPARNIENIITDMFLQNQPSSGSDAEIADFINNDLYDADVFSVDKPGLAENRGDFFPLLLTEEAENGLLRCGIDLKNCQIFSEKSVEEQLLSDSSLITKNCLWNTLQLLLPDKGDLALRQLGLKVVAGNSCKKRILAKISQLYNINVRLYEIIKNTRQNRVYSVIKPSYDEISIGFMNGHFFPNFCYKPSASGTHVDINGLIKRRKLGGSTHDEYAFGDAGFRKRGGVSITVSNLLWKLNKSDYLKPYNPEISQKLGLARTEAELKKNNPFIEECFIPTPSVIEKKKKKDKRSDVSEDVFYADFESFECESTGRHIPYLACATPRGGGFFIVKANPRIIKTDVNESLGKELLAAICKKSDKKNIKIYFHNLRYDANFLYDAGLTQIKSIEDDARLYQLQGVFTINKTTYNLTIRDTYSYLTCRLADFDSMFDIKSGAKWNDFPYQIFKRNTLSDLFPSNTLFAPEELELIPQQYKQNPSSVEIYRYASDYCKQDVLVLQQGFDQFREKALELGIDVDGPMTAASFAMAFLKKEGVLEGVEQLSGSARAYVQESVVGGRVCVQGNNPIHYVADNNKDTHLVDFDAVSLYPSAMASIHGLPIGHPQRFEGAPPDDDNFYVATVKVRAIGVELHMSTLSMEIDGVRRWGKGCVRVGDVLVLNRIQIESARLFQGVVFDFVGGLRWSEGYNPKICSTIKKLFEWRLRLKAEKNPLESVVKLIMNSAYGKFGQKPHDTKVRWIWGSEIEAVTKAAETGSGFIYLEAANHNKTLWKLKYKTPDVYHQNRAHCASLILAQSKHIMYQVTTPLDEDVLYTDTDSMILPKRALTKLKRPDLVGKKMGQFHTDLSWIGGGGGEVTATEGYFLAKKTYVLRLENSDAPGEAQYHFRAKGVPNSTIKATCSKLKMNPIELYKEICEKGVTFDLTLGRPCFKQHPTSIVTLKSFERRLGPFPITPALTPDEETDRPTDKLTLDEQLEIYLNELEESL